MGSYLPATAQLQPFSWLKGKWKLESKESYEVWSDVKGKLKAISFELNDGDSTITETIEIQSRNSQFYFIPDVAGDQPPVEFKITELTASYFVAENPDHDFPNVIRYQLLKINGQQILSATIEGGGKTIHFKFYKVR